MNSIIGYNANILLQSGLSDVQAHWGYVLFTIVNFLTTIGGVLLVHRKGRKFLLSVGSAGIIVSLLCTGSLFRSTERLRVGFLVPAVQSMVSVDQTLSLRYDNKMADVLLGGGTLGNRRTAGLRVIIDLHAAPGGQTGVNHDDGPGFPLVFYVPHYRRLTVALWRELANRYRDDPTILGYDLLNVTISPYNDMDYLNPRLEPLYREIVAACPHRRQKPRGAARRCAMEHKLRRIQPAVPREHRLHVSQVLGQTDARRSAKLSGFQQSLEGAFADRRDWRIQRRVESKLFASSMSGSASAGASGPTSTLTPTPRWFPYQSRRVGI